MKRFSRLNKFMVKCKPGTVHCELEAANSVTVR